MVIFIRFLNKVLFVYFGDYFTNNEEVILGRGVGRRRGGFR